MDWQPIETAPKDDKPVLAYEPDCGVSFITWSAEHDGWFDEYGLREDPWEGNKYHPTHWMPLPEPPSA